MVGDWTDNALRYLKAGWHPFPLPTGQKFPPPAGRTGWNGSDLTEDEILADTDTTPRNIGLRMPVGVIGIDVDEYGSKHGAVELDKLLRGRKLPRTWCSTNREDGVSSIRFYRVREGTDLLGILCPGVETVQRHHRYAVASPSTHPEGRTYRWLDPAGRESTEPPQVADLPELPPQLVREWTKPETGSARGTPKARDERVQEWLEDHSEGEPCRALAKELKDYLSASGSRHDAMVHTCMRLVNLATQGHRGGRQALEGLSDLFVPAVELDRDGAGLEFWRSLAGAVARVDVNPPPRKGCCAPTVDGEPLGQRDDEEQDEEPRPTLRDRLIWRERLGDLPRPRALIEGVLDTGQITVLAGPYGTLKSFVALSWLASVATGTPWLGRSVSRAGRTLYVASEESGAHDRLTAWERHHKVEIPRERLAVLRDGVNLGDPDELGELVQVIRSDEFELIVVDTLNRSMPGLDENSTKDMSLATAGAARLLRGTGGSGSVVIVHHTGKDGTIRGNSALSSNADAVLMLSGDPVSGVSMGAAKRKDRPKGGTTWFRFKAVPGTDSGVLDEMDTDSPLTQGVRVQDRILAHFRVHFGETGVTRTQLLESLHREGPELAKSSFNRGLGALVTKKFLTVEGSGRAAVYRLARARKVTVDGAD